MAGDPHHDEHGHEDHGDDHGHDDHHDDHAAHGPDPYIVIPSSEPVARKDNLAFALIAFLTILVLLAVLMKAAG